MRNNIEFQYLDLMTEILETGIHKSDRTGTGTRSLFGVQMRHDMRTGFPLLTTKRVFWKGVLAELLWIISGSTNINGLVADDVHIWDAWATEDGDLGPVYGAMWRNWPKREGGFIDQLDNVITELFTNPDSRRLVVSSWNPELLPNESFSPNENAAMGKQALPPCHTLFQFFSHPLTFEQRMDWAAKNLSAIEFDCISKSSVKDLMLLEFNVPSRGLSLQLLQRSGDWLLGIPFNIASYSALLMMVGKLVNMVPVSFVHTVGDAHIYNNHIEQCREQRSRMMRDLPQLVISGHQNSIDTFKFSDFELVGYDPHPAIKAAVSV